MANKVGYWLQVGANVGILIGLVLVGIQIQQNTELTRASLLSEYIDSWATLDQTLQSENFAVTKARAIYTPQELSNSEMLEMHGHMYTIVDQIRRVIALNQLGMFDEEVVQTLEAVVRDGFGNHYSRAWWGVERKEFGENEITQLIDRVVAEMPEDQDLRDLEAIRKSLSK